MTPTSAVFLFVRSVVHQFCQPLGCSWNPLVNRLMAVRLPDRFGDQCGKLPLRNIPLMKHHAANNDPIDCIHLRKTAIDLLLENAICYLVFRPPRIRNLCSDLSQRFDGNSIATAPVRAITAIAHANMPCRSVTFPGPLELFPQLPIGPHDGIKHLVGHRCPGRVTRQIIGLLRTRFCFV